MFIYLIYFTPIYSTCQALNLVIDRHIFAMIYLPTGNSEPFH